MTFENTAATPIGGMGLLDRAVCLVCRFHSIGNLRKVPPSLIEVDADKELVRVNKALLDSDELKEIARFDGKVRQWLYSRGLPSMFRDGVYLWPNDLIEEAERKLPEFAAERQALVEKFIAVYPALVEMARTRLKALFNPRDYRTAEEVRAAFRMDWQYVSFTVPQSLRSISNEIFEREREKAQERWAEANDAVQQLLRTSMSELVDHLVNRLTGTKDGKPKVFRNSMVENINDFLSTFDARNITNDDHLKLLVDRAKELMDGIEPDRLRKDDALRQYVRHGFSGVKAQLDAMMVDKPKRAISFDFGSV